MLKSTKCKFFLVTDYHFDALRCLVRRSLIYDIVFDSRSCSFVLDSWLSGRAGTPKTLTGKKRKKTKTKSDSDTPQACLSRRILFKKNKHFFLTLSTDFVSSPSLSFQTNLPGLFEMVATSGLYITAVRQRPPAQTCKS